MSSGELSADEKELFKCVSDCNVLEVKHLINDLKVSVNCCDDQGMTPLQHAAFKGSYEMCKLLLDCGAEVNTNRHIYGYSALCLAALSNKSDVVTLLLEHGADTEARNSNKRTASEMAAFVGNRRAVCAINNYIPKCNIDYFTEIHGLETEPKLPIFLTGPVHKLVIMPNIHPVRLALYLQNNASILLNLKRVINVLNILSEKQLKEMSREKFSLKFHHIGFVLYTVLEFINSQNKTDEEGNAVDQNTLDTLIKSWLKGKDNWGISVNLEKFLRKGISSYPFRESFLFQQVVSTISKTEIGNEPNTFTVLFNAINGEHFVNEYESCATCGEQNAEKKCSACKSVQYCDKTCQKLHWFIHKTDCKKK